MEINKNRYLPLLMALSTIVGIIIGTFYANHFSGNRLNIINSGSNRLNNLLHIIDDQYVDTVNIDSLVDKAIPQILADLDPHSVYINAKDAQAVGDDLKGSFSGVGIEFVIRNDTLRVQGVIKNGPAERAGILAGDKIVSIDDKPFVGKEVTNEEAMKRLKGQKDTKVKIGVIRYGEKKMRTFSVTRGDIPMHSVMATYMLDDNTGYIRIKSFGENTYPEVLVALAQLSQEGFSRLVIDLRDNTGGYLQSAVQIINEFLPKDKLIVYTKGRDKLIVYTKGRKSPRQDYRSDGKGSYQNMPLVVLINEGSASASEIFAGAIQDNDRGTIIGRRSFGKGLVQQQIGFTDGSLIRLTVARYYTPSGRCIQKPYVPGEDSQYQGDLAQRYEHGEFFSQDSIKHEGPAYHTSLGRLVYGGGGITPDIFVPEDTLAMTSYYKQAAMNGLILQFAFAYTDNNRQKLSEFTEMNELNKYLIRHIVSRVVYNIMNEQDWLMYLNEDDKVVEKALQVLNNGTSFPKKSAHQK